MSGNARADLSRLEPILAEARKRGQAGLIEALAGAQRVYGYLPEAVLAAIADGLRIKRSAVYGVATFYQQFHLKPLGAHLIEVCRGVSCHVNGGARVMGAIEEHLGVRAGETTGDGGFTLLAVDCFGLCPDGPNMVIDGRAIGRLTPERAVAEIQAIEKQG